ncbi:unnamed protein product [Didymodactylos carnosus]|uniref:SWIM-type domain-containing protein n=1 Tax=Didymodactylos carnosus TaxID=1234261 RepID=A0A8S2DKG0_9BILA|nr:unnamed protein product [Didymodactylos carnosus]CAF3735939.1 unnamed protein product [Didymodactylos carnosus]
MAPPLDPNSRLPDNLKMTDRGEDFILYEDDKMIIFTTKTNLSVLKSFKHWFADGTFKVCPDDFYQLFTLHALMTPLMIPLVYGLLIDKSAADYNKFFEKILDEDNFDPESILTDFETGTIKLIKEMFPNVLHKGCLFHFGQCVWRQIQTRGLSTKYKDDEDFCWSVKNFLALAFLPLVKGLDLVAGEFDDDADGFVEYFEKVWIEDRKKRGNGRTKPQFEHDLWNVYERVVNDVPHPINSIEGWRSAFATRVSITHPTIAKLAEESIKVNENRNLECLCIQTSQMKAWFEKYPNIVHIDSTFKVNIENYQLYICLVQNANLKGVPFAYCLMISGIKDNLEFFYSAMGKYNDLTQTQVVMVDKDLTNVDVLQHYFNKARILLWVFHVLKYLKNQIHVLKIPLTNRMNIMKNIRRLLYANDQMSAIYLKEIKINLEGTDFYEYFEKNCLSFGSQITNKVIELFRKQNDELKLKHYFIEEIKDNKWKIDQKDEEKNRFITSSIIYRDSCKDLLFCDCQFYLQNQLPCRHMIVLLNKINDDMYDQTYEIQQKIISLHKRWLKNPVNYYLNEIDDYDNIQSYDSQFLVTQVTAQKNKILYSNDKYNNFKPTLDLLTARIIQSGNRTEPFINLLDDIQQQSTAKQAKFNHIEEQNVMKFNQEQDLEHDIKSFQEDNEDLPKLELESEPKEEQADILLKEKVVLNYSPVINPRGRPRGKASLVAYKEKDKKDNQDKVNKKRTYKQTSPDLKRYNFKRNKKLGSIRDVCDNTTWLTDFRIYLFFELLHKQFWYRWRLVDVASTVSVQYSRYREISWAQPNWSHSTSIAEQCERQFL